MNVEVGKKSKRLLMIGVLLVIIFVCALVVFNHRKYTPYTPKEQAKIYLYGELHGKKAILEREYELWKEHYDKDKMRYLFVELPYYTAEYLNIWMQAEGDQILNELYEDGKGTQSNVPEEKEFYIKIKTNCPETVFCGTDVGHQYDTTGERYLQYLKKNGEENSENYRLAMDNINQGKKYYDTEDEKYRENVMTENFVNAYDKLSGATIMGIYGDAHSDPRKKNYTKEVDCMAKQIKAHYGDIIQYNSYHELDGNCAISKI